MESSGSSKTSEQPKNDREQIVSYVRNQKEESSYVSNNWGFEGYFCLKDYNSNYLGTYIHYIEGKFNNYKLYHKNVWNRISALGGRNWISLCSRLVKNSLFTCFWNVFSFLKIKEVVTRYYKNNITYSFLVISVI